jgi:hypothetical protein
MRKAAQELLKAAQAKAKGGARAPCAALTRSFAALASRKAHLIDERAHALTVLFFAVLAHGLIDAFRRCGLSDIGGKEAAGLGFLRAAGLLPT